MELSPPLSSLESRVRFDDECTLIPDPQPRSRMPRLLVKSFSFKRRHSQDSYSHSPTSPHHCHASLPSTGTFPRPALSRKSSLNVDLPRSPPPIHRQASLPPSPIASAHPRAPSLPQLQRSERVTIPLRPCCPDCFSATEHAVIMGENWTENFTRAARRRRRASADNDNHPYPPHVLSGNQAAIQWSSNASADNTPATFHSVVVVDEADHKASLESKLTDSPDGEEELSDAVNALDRLSVKEEDPKDGHLPPLLTRRNPWLSPIPSNNGSIDNVSLTPCDVPLYLPAQGAQVSPPPSPLPKTPPSVYSSPITTPKVSSSPPQSERESPRIGSSFRLPKGVTLMRAGADILRGVSIMGAGPV